MNGWIWCPAGLVKPRFLTGTAPSLTSTTHSRGYIIFPIDAARRYGFLLNASHMLL